MTSSSGLVPQARKASHRIGSLLVLLGCAITFIPSLPGSADAAGLPVQSVLDESGEFACLSLKETALLTALNEYRVKNHLSKVNNSRSLNKVARIHAMDLAANHPESGKDARGIDCNLHSWSDQGFWSPFCYTGDHYYSEKMRKKPGEITRQAYSAIGYENVYWFSGAEATPSRVMEAWQKSPAHNAMILETNTWQKSNWAALGVGIYKNVAVIWLGSVADPLGPLPACGPEAGKKSTP